MLNRRLLIVIQNRSNLLRFGYILFILNKMLIMLNKIFTTLGTLYVC